MEPGLAGVIVSAIAGLSGVVITAMIKFIPQRGSMEQPQLNQSTEERFDQKLDNIQKDVTQLEIKVGNLEGEQKRAAIDAAGGRNELGEIRRDVASLRRMLDAIYGKLGLGGHQE